eukprot:1096211-Prymnesium_polylepis.1
MCGARCAPGARRQCSRHGWGGGRERVALGAFRGTTSVFGPCPPRRGSVLGNVVRASGHEGARASSRARRAAHARLRARCGDGHGCKGVCSAAAACVRCESGVVVRERISVPTTPAKKTNNSGSR